MKLRTPRKKGRYYGGGRRPLSKDDRTVLLGVSVTASMKAAIEKAAEDRSLSTSNFVRIIIKRFLDAERGKAEEAGRAKEQTLNSVWPLSKPRFAGGAR